MPAAVHCQCALVVLEGSLISDPTAAAATLAFCLPLQVASLCWWCRILLVWGLVVHSEKKLNPAVTWLAWEQVWVRVNSCKQDVIT